MSEAPSRHRHHVAHAARLHPWKDLTDDVHGFNARAAIVIVDVLGSMPCFWFFNLLALVSLPAVLTLVAPSLKTVFPVWLTKVSLISLVGWIAQSWIQLTSLSVLQVSNNAQGRQLDHNLHEILQAVSQLDTRADAIGRSLADLHEKIGG